MPPRGIHKTKDWDGDIQIAKELLYPEKVIRALANEPNPIRRSNILRDARIAECNKRR